MNTAMKIVHEFVYRRVRSIVDVDELFMLREELDDLCCRALEEGGDLVDPDELLSDAWRPIQAEWRRLCSVGRTAEDPCEAFTFELDLSHPLVGKPERRHGRPRPR